MKTRFLPQNARSTSRWRASTAGRTRKIIVKYKSRTHVFCLRLRWKFDSEPVGIPYIPLRMGKREGEDSRTEGTSHWKLNKYNTSFTRGKEKMKRKDRIDTGTILFYSVSRRVLNGIAFCTRAPLSYFGSTVFHWLLLEKKNKTRRGFVGHNGARIVVFRRTMLRSVPILETVEFYYEIDSKVTLDSVKCA